MEEVSVGLKIVLAAAEDDDVVCGGGQGEEEHFELEAHPQEHSTRDEREDATVNRVLEGRESTKKHASYYVLICKTSEYRNVVGIRKFLKTHSDESIVFGIFNLVPAFFFYGGLEVQIVSTNYLMQKRI